MRNKLNSWEILSIYFYRWKIFAIIFAITIIFSAILIVISEKDKQQELALQLEAQKLEQEKLEAEHKKALEIYETEMAKMANHKYYSFYLHIKNIDNKPLISQNLLNEILRDSAPKFSLSISPLEHNIFKLTFLSDNKKEALITQKTLIKELDSAHIVQFIKSSIKEAKRGIFTSSEIYFDKQIIFVNNPPPKSPPPPQQQNDKKEEVDFIQTSLRSKIILAFISAFIFGSIAIFTREFWEANKHKLKRQSR